MPFDVEALERTNTTWRVRSERAISIVERWEVSTYGKTFVENPAEKWPSERRHTIRGELTPYNESPGLVIGLDTEGSVRDGFEGFAPTDRAL